jgi:DnaJ like chaperone protein
MGWLGKIVGGTLGFAIGGPLGAIAGVAFGHVFDRSNDVYYDSESMRPLPGEQAQFTFFVATFSMLAKLAQVDGRVTSQEVDTINRYMMEELHLDPEGRMVATNIFNAAMNSPNSFEDFARQFYGQFYNQPQILEMMLDILIRVSISDSAINAQEERMIHSAAQIFNFSRQTIDTIMARYVPTSDKYYAVLGLDRSASEEQIKKQYRKLVMEYHPDRIISKGLPEEFTQLANEKFRELQDAYDQIKKERSIR